VLRAVDEAGLRGRGGAGYPTARKWRAALEVESDRRYLVANGYEADPSALVDRTLMEQDPHLVVEGVALAAYTIGATQAYLAVKADYATAVRRLRAAVRQAEEEGLLGTDILETGLDLRIEVREVQGRFVLGEETALLRALEERRAMPEQRPPYPAVRGLWERPTVVNNVETLAAVPWIVENGGRAYSALGTKGQPGTTLVQLSGAVRRPGVLEAPLGTPIGELIDAAGGPSGRGRLKAVLVGGPSGGFLPAGALGTPLDYAALDAAGGIMGSGTILAAGRDVCIVELATLLERYMADEACGKSLPCRIGTARLCEIGQRFIHGTPRPTDQALLTTLAGDIRASALCGHERTAPNPLTTGMRYFGEEFEDHIKRSTCPAGVCRPLRVSAPPAPTPKATRTPRRRPGTTQERPAVHG
jgi:NADH:ubiquinone oxidoreductase subunit F (NADH-binding)